MATYTSNLSYIAADAAMARLDGDNLATMDQTYDFLRASRLWDTGSAAGGYFAASDVNGTWAPPPCAHDRRPAYGC